MLCAPGSRQTSKPLDATRRLLAAAIAAPLLAVARRALAKEHQASGMMAVVRVA